jgi:signal transduction histidine kinase
MSFSKTFSRQPSEWIFTEAIILMLVVGFFDFATGYEVSVSIFYAAPIFLVAWFCDKKMAFLSAMIAGIVWWWADVQSGHPYLHNWQEGWETFVRLGYFIIVAVGGSALKAQRDAAHARIALLEHTQRLEHEIIGISEREQRRIGQDLHDGLCQFLAGIGCAATSLKGDLNKLQLNAEANVADELATLLQDAVVQTRNLARGLVPVKMDEVGLASALEELTVSITRLRGVECSFESNGSIVTLEDSVATHLYRIAQEAINNAIKHGRVRRIAVSLGKRGTAITLQIADDGIGIFKTGNSSRGMGLNIMKYRARLSGGELRIEKRPGGGTIVSCTVRPTMSELNERAA